MNANDSAVASSAASEPWRDQILWRPQLPLDHCKSRYPGFSPHQERLRAGTVQTPGGCALGVDLLKDQDAAVHLRDGPPLYVDIYRPADVEGPLPTIVAWGPYGKGNGGNQSLDDFPFRAGVPRKWLSGLQVWEGPDPSWWCARGYAVVNVDARGACSSEGNVALWGTQEGRDGHDVVEWIARQPWSNGRVGLTGNSWLAMSQWFIAAERPPHLAAIAPWEGSADAYRSSFQGGVIDTGFARHVLGAAVGKGLIEDFGAMAEREPLIGPYWQDKIAQVELIDTPVYVVGSWTNFVHTPATFDAWRRLRTSQRWLRVHNSMEWHDYYSDASRQDLLRFFDRFLKDTRNGWDKTPRVRLAVLGDEGRDEVNRPMAEFPPREIGQVAYALDARERSLLKRGSTAALESRCAGPQDSLVFDLPVRADSEVIGFSKLRLWIQLHDATDQDLFVALERLDKRGRRVAARTFPLPNRLFDRVMRLVHRSGRIAPLDLLFPTRVKGQLRVSQREADEALSTLERPMPAHRSAAPVNAGEMVCVEIAIDPVAMRLRAGQTLRLRIAGHNLSPIPLPEVTKQPPRGSGRFSVWSGGHFDSTLFVPLRLRPKIDGPPG